MSSKLPAEYKITFVISSELSGLLGGATWDGIEILVPNLDSTVYHDVLQLFRNVHSRKNRRVIIGDMGTGLGTRSWAWVSDGINRSGISPLRGLSHHLSEPFLDLSNLYTVPFGLDEAAVEITNLREGDKAMDDRITCSQLHLLAILAKGAGLEVIGLVVNREHPPPVTNLLQQINSAEL